MKYVYTGYDNTGFKPYGLCIDSAGRVLITDFYDYRVHILDRDGRFLRYLMNWKDGLALPVSIDVDGEGHAWVGQRGTLLWMGEIKVVKYLQ